MTQDEIWSQDVDEFIERQRRELDAESFEIMALSQEQTLDEYDPDEGAAYINEIMASDDAKDPYLESYQNHGKNE